MKVKIRICNRRKRKASKPKGKQESFHAGHTLEQINIDIMEPLMPTQQENKYVLVIVDQFTKWVEAYPLKDQIGETVARVVAEEFIARFECPLEIHTDQGRNFDGVFSNELCKIMDINKTRTTSYRPSANGQVERLNRSIAQIIHCCVVLNSLKVNLRSTIVKLLSSSYKSSSVVSTTRGRQEPEFPTRRIDLPDRVGDEGKPGLGVAPEGSGLVGPCGLNSWSDECGQNGPNRTQRYPGQKGVCGITSCVDQ